MSMIGWSQNVARQFRDYIKGWLVAVPSLYNYFVANDLKTNVGEGQDRFTYLAAEEPEGGRLVSNIHDYNTIQPQWVEESVGLDHLVARIILSKQDVDRYRTGNWLRGDLVQDTINLVMPKVMNQMDQLLAWGDEYPDSPDALEVFRSSGEITGIFNGGTEYRAGIGGDEDMQEAGDYIFTVEGMRDALKTAKHDLDQYMLLSDLTTFRFAAVENQFFSTVGITERQRIFEYKWIKDWMNSVNFIDRTGIKYRMAMIAPQQKNPAVGGKGPQKNFELFMSYDFAVHPDAGGQTIDNYYVWYIICGFKLVEYRSTAIQRTRTLVLT